MGLGVIKFKVHSTHLERYPVAKIRETVSLIHQGCQMVCVQTKNTNFGKLWTVLLWKISVYFITIWSILRPLETF
jgi:hypothetical protein